MPEQTSPVDFEAIRHKTADWLPNFISVEPEPVHFFSMLGMMTAALCGIGIELQKLNEKVDSVTAPAFSGTHQRKGIKVVN